MSHSWNVGSDNPRAKLDETKVNEIRILFAEGTDIAELAKLYGVTRSNIWYVVRVRTWKHVKA